MTLLLLYKTLVMNSSCLTLLKIDEILGIWWKDQERLWGLLFRDIQKASGCGSQQLPPVASTWVAVGPDGLEGTATLNLSVIHLLFFFSCTSLIFNQHLHNLDQIWNLFFACCLIACGATSCTVHLLVVLCGSLVDADGSTGPVEGFLWLGMPSQGNRSDSWPRGAALVHGT